MATPTQQPDADERYNKGQIRADQLVNRENTGGNYPNYSPDGGRDAIGMSSDDTANNFDKPTDVVRDGEGNPSGSWQNNLTQRSAPGTKKKGAARFLNKRFGIGGGIVGTLIAAAIGLNMSAGSVLIHTIMNITNRTDTVSSALDARARLALRSKFFTPKNVTKGKCSGVITYKCRMITFSEKDVANAKQSGWTFTDKQGNPIEADGYGRYSGATQVVNSTEIGKNGSVVIGEAKVFTADAFTSRNLATNSELRALTKDIFPSRFAMIHAKIGTAFAKARGLVRNMKWTNTGSGGDEKANKKAVVENVAEGQKNAANVAGSIDEGDYSGAISDAESKITGEITDGTVDGAPTNAIDALGDAEADINTSGKVYKAFNTLSATSLLTEICTVERYAVTIHRTAMLAGVTAAMIWFSQLASTSGKEMTGEATTNDAASVANILYTPNAAGQTFGDSAGYSYAVYGKSTDTPIQTGISGGSLLSIIGTFLTFFSTIKVGSMTANTFCKGLMTGTGQVISNILGVAITVFSGGTATALKTIGEKGGLKLAMTLLKDSLKDKLEKTLTKDAFKNALNTFKRDGLRIAASFGGMILASLIVEHYFVPYLASVATGTLITGNENGVAALDTAMYGAGATMSSLGLAHGMVPLTKDQYLAYERFDQSETSTYIADMRREANPLDLSNPYSTANSLASTVGTFLTKFNFVQHPSLIAMAPSNLLSNLSLSNIISTAKADDASDKKTLMDQCQDASVTSLGLATDPYCNPITGFNDVGMLTTAKNTDVESYMEQTGQIESDGDTIVPGSAYEKFRSTCLVNTEDKAISSIDLDGSNLDPICYDESNNNRTDIKNYRLYFMDHDDIDDTFENGAAQDDNTTTTDAENSSVAGTAPPGTTLLAWNQIPSEATKSDGWTLPMGADYSQYQCPAGAPEEGVMKNKANNTTMRICKIDGKRVSSVIASRVLQLKADAKKAGVTMNVTSGYRTYDEQVYLYGCFVSKACNNGNEAAKPGTSNHEVGLAIDWSASDNYNWLRTNGKRYGFINYPPEAWHWSMNGH